MTVGENIKRLRTERGLTQKQLGELSTKEKDAIKGFAKVGSIAGSIFGIGISALSGWLLGKWADSIANNDARKHA